MRGKSGISTDVQVSQHDSTVHTQMLFLPKQKTDNCDVIIMMSLVTLLP